MKLNKETKIFLAIIVIVIVLICIYFLTKGNNGSGCTDCGKCHDKKDCTNLKGCTWDGNKCSSTSGPVPPPPGPGPVPPPPGPGPIPSSGILGLPNALGTQQTMTNYWDPSKGLDSSIKAGTDITSCLQNYFSMLYSAVDRRYWTKCSESQLRTIYNMLDWYYTPFVIDPMVPFMNVSSDAKSLVGMGGLSKLGDIGKSSPTPEGQRLRPLIGPYAAAYIQFFPMAGYESVLNLQCNNPQISGNPENDDTTKKCLGDQYDTGWWVNPSISPDFIPVAMNASPSWNNQKTGATPPDYAPKDCSASSPDSCKTWNDLNGWIGGGDHIGRPLMSTFFIQPYGIARQGFPSYAYVETVDFTSEAGGRQQEANLDGTCKYNAPNTSALSSFCRDYNYQPGCGATADDFQTAWKYQVGKPSQGVTGPAYVGTDAGNVVGWGGPVKENFTTDPKSGDGCSMFTSGWTDTCLCMASSSGVVDNPNVKSTDLVGGGTVQMGQRCLADNKGCDLLYYLTDDHKPMKIDGSSTPQMSLYKKTSGGAFQKVVYPQAQYCSPGGSWTDKYGCSGSWYSDLFYPIKGYGKFTNLGRSGTYFNYVHALIAVSDRDNTHGSQLRRPLSAVAAEHPAGGCCGPQGGPCIGKQIAALSGHADVSDQRQILRGYVTVPRSDKFTGALAQYEKAILAGGGGCLDWSGPEGGGAGQWKFIPGKPQVTWEGGELGCGQTRWMKGEYDPFTKQTLQTANKWMNPMDSGEFGELYLCGKYFRQYYCPPELNIKNPNYNKSLSDLQPKWTPTMIQAFCGSSKGTGAWGNANDDASQQFGLAWCAGIQCYGDTGIHDQNSFPFGLLGVTGTADNCLYDLIQAMGWQSLVISMKDDICGQPKACEYPYYDSEILFSRRKVCQSPRTMQDGCGPLGPVMAPSDDQYASYNMPADTGDGATITCQLQVTLDISVCMDRYLLDNFVPAFVDRSTTNDTSPKNMNKIKYNATQVTRKNFAFSGASTSVPAQQARKMYNPPTHVKYCSICPGQTVGNNGQGYPMEKGKGWMQLSQKYIGNPYNNTQEWLAGWGPAVDTLYGPWANTNIHKKYGCYSVDS